MSEIARTARVAATPEQVWDVLSDFGGLATWAHTVDHSCPTTDQPDGPGAARRVQVGRTALIERIVTWDPSTALGYEIAGLPGVVRTATNTWSLVRSGDGTAVTLTTAVDCGNLPPQRAIARAVARKMAETSAGLLADLERHLEEAP